MADARMNALVQTVEMLTQQLEDVREELIQTAMVADALRDQLKAQSSHALATVALDVDAVIASQHSPTREALHRSQVQVRILVCIRT